MGAVDDRLRPNAMKKSMKMKLLTFGGLVILAIVILLWLGFLPRSGPMIWASAYNADGRSGLTSVTIKIVDSKGESVANYPIETIVSRANWPGILVNKHESTITYQEDLVWHTDNQGYALVKYEQATGLRIRLHSRAGDRVYSLSSNPRVKNLGHTVLDGRTYLNTSRGEQIGLIGILNENRPFVFNIDAKASPADWEDLLLQEPRLDKDHQYMNRR